MLQLLVGISEQRQTTDCSYATSLRFDDSLKIKWKWICAPDRLMDNYGPTFSMRWSMSSPQRCQNFSEFLPLQQHCIALQTAEQIGSRASDEKLFISHAYGHNTVECRTDDE